MSHARSIDTAVRAYTQARPRAEGRVSDDRVRRGVRRRRRLLA